MHARVRFWLLVLVKRNLTESGSMPVNAINAGWGSAGWQGRIKMRVSGMYGITISTSINPPGLGPLNAAD